jgi:hypothetical protein
LRWNSHCLKIVAGRKDYLSVFGEI